MIDMNSLNNNNSSPTITLDGLTVALLVSSILYLCCLFLAKRKLTLLNRISPELGTKKLLVLSVGLVCTVRIMSFVGVMALNIANVRAHYSLHPMPLHSTNDNNTSNNNDNNTSNNNDKTREFYDGAMTVLFDLPNCIVVSTYVLLTLVWAECFLQSRFHNENSVKWRTQWLMGYMVFNSALYGTQTVLYILVFWPFGMQRIDNNNSSSSGGGGGSSILRTVLYAAMTGINFVAVALVVVLYVYLNVEFSGFPFRSPHLKQSLGKISSLLSLWSFTRLTWGVAMLLVYIYNIELLQEGNEGNLSSLILFVLFVFCEIVPIFGMLDYSYMNIIGFESNATNDMNHLANSGGGGGGMNTMMMMRENNSSPNAAAELGLLRDGGGFGIPRQFGSRESIMDHHQQHPPVVSLHHPLLKDYTTAAGVDDDGIDSE